MLLNSRRSILVGPCADSSVIRRIERGFAWAMSPSTKWCEVPVKRNSIGDYTFKKGLTSQSLRLAEREAHKAFFFFGTSKIVHRWRPPLVNEDWVVLSQAIHKGVTLPDMTAMSGKVKSLDKLVWRNTNDKCSSQNQKELQEAYDKGTCEREEMCERGNRYLNKAQAVCLEKLGGGADTTATLDGHRMCRVMD